MSRVMNEVRQWLVTIDNEGFRVVGAEAICCLVRTLLLVACRSSLLHAEALYCTLKLFVARRSSLLPCAFYKARLVTGRDIACKQRCCLAHYTALHSHALVWQLSRAMIRHACSHVFVCATSSITHALTCLRNIVLHACSRVCATSSFTHAHVRTYLH